MNWCLHDDETDQQYKNSYPNEAYKFNTKVFDQYVESYVLYPAQVTYTVTHKFRDFYIDLSREGLAVGNCNNVVSGNKQAITFKGSFIDNNKIEMHREFHLTKMNFFIHRIEV